MYSFVVNFWNFIIQIFQLSLDLNKLYLFFQICFQNPSCKIVFGSGINHQPHSIFKSKPIEFHSKNIGLFSGNDTTMDGNFIWMHRDMCMRKVLIATVSYAECNTMALNSKLYKVVSYIQDNKYRSSPNIYYPGYMILLCKVLSWVP